MYNTSDHVSSSSPLLRGMVIDDSPTVCKILEITLRRHHINVVAFPTAELAEWYLSSQLQNNEPLPEFVIVDIVLPGIDGFTFLRNLQHCQRCRTTRAIILTRRDGMLDRLKGRLAGASVYLTKPFTEEEVLTTLKTLFPEKAAMIAQYSSN